MKSSGMQLNCFDIILFKQYTILLLQWNKQRRHKKYPPRSIDFSTCANELHRLFFWDRSPSDNCYPRKTGCCSQLFFFKSNNSHFNQMLYFQFHKTSGHATPQTWSFCLWEVTPWIREASWSCPCGSHCTVDNLYLQHQLASSQSFFAFERGLIHFKSKHVHFKESALFLNSR